MNANKGLVTATALTAILAVVALWIAGRQEHSQAMAGMRAGVRNLAQVAPLVFFTFILISTMPLIVTQDTWVKWLGTASGWRGVALGCMAGAIAPGGPLVRAVIGAGLIKAGVGIGALISFLTAGALWSLVLLPAEIGLLGIRTVAVRIAVTFFVPPFVGALAHLLFGR